MYKQLKNKKKFKFKRKKYINKMKQIEVADGNKRKEIKSLPKIIIN